MTPTEHRCHQAIETCMSAMAYAGIIGVFEEDIAKDQAEALTERIYAWAGSYHQLITQFFNPSTGEWNHATDRNASIERTLRDAINRSRPRNGKQQPKPDDTGNA